MIDHQIELGRKQKILKLDYVDGMSQKISDLSEAWSCLKQNWSLAKAEEIYRAIQSLCSAADTYGFAGITKHSGHLIQEILMLIEENRSPQKDEVEKIELLLRRITSAADNRARQLNKDLQEAAALPPDKGVLIYILEEKYLASRLARDLSEQGFPTKVFKNVADLDSAVAASPPKIVLADQGTIRSASDMIRSEGWKYAQLFLLSEEADIQTRLEAARFGAYRFFKKPVESQKLVEEITYTIDLSTAGPCRVLIIDDDTAVAKLHGQILEDAGIETRLVNDPFQSLAAMNEFGPDLVLVEVSMQRCSGPELAAILSQDHHYASVPILFMSSTNDVEKKLNDFGMLGADYLLKPIDSRRLISSVRARVRQRQDLQQARIDYVKATKESRMRELALNQHAIVSITDATGVITYVNQKFCDISGFTREDLIGQDHNIINSGLHSKDFFEQMWATISRGDVWHGEIRNLKKGGGYYWVASTIVPFLDEAGLPYQYVSMRTDVTQIKTLELEVSRHAELLDALHEAMASFMSAGQFKTVIRVMLDNLMQLTGSQYGIMAEVLFDESRPILKGHAINSLLWNEDEREQFEAEFESGKTVDKNVALLRKIIRSGELVTIKDLSGDPEGALPGGNHRLRNLISVPVFFGDQLVGIYAFARVEKEYSENLASFLDAFNSTYGVMIHAKRVAEMEEEVTFYLERARKEAESASRAKSEFLSRMSHELRTPLNIILGFAQLMIANSELDESDRENVDEILRAGHHLLDLVSEVLDLSRIEAGELELDIQSVEIAAAIADSVSLVSSLATSKNIEVVYERDRCSGAVVYADMTRLNQALLNFLSNAMKYTQPGGKVLVSGEHRPDSMFRIIVSDSGPGISVEKYDQLFTAFNRLGAETSGEDGTGIGLFITKSLIEGMGGKVGYKAGSLGGAAFWMDLPAATNRRSLDSPAVVDADQDVTADIEERASGIYRFLYIEDNRTNLNLVKQLIHLRWPNAELMLADDPYFGLELLGKHSFDIVLLDINMPGMDGHQVLARIREDDNITGLPVVAVSASAMPADIQAGIDAGFDEYVTKPIRVDEFYETVDRLLSQKSF